MNVNSGEYHFLSGRGWLPEAAQKIAENHGVTLLEYTNPECLCGHGCPPRKCEQSRRHAFAAPNKGEPFNRQIAAAVEADLREAGIEIG